MTKTKTYIVYQQQQQQQQQQQLCLLKWFRFRCFLFVHKQQKHLKKGTSNIPPFKKRPITFEIVFREVVMSVFAKDDILHLNQNMYGIRSRQCSAPL